MKRKILAVWLAAAMALVPAVGCSDAGEAEDVSEYRLDAYMRPVWEGAQVVNETAMILRNADGSLPDYGVTEALLGGVYYRQLQTIIRRKYDGDVRRILEKSVGSQVDMLNLMHILRMKRYFPQEDNYLPVLLPYHYKIKPQMIHAMCAAPSAEAVLELAQQTPYGRIFDQHSGEDLNYLYTATIYRTSRRQLMMGKPSIYSAVALMNLREIELKAVVSAVEAAKYQMALNPSILDMMDR